MIHAPLPARLLGVALLGLALSALACGGGPSRTSTPPGPREAPESVELLMKRLDHPSTRNGAITRAGELLAQARAAGAEPLQARREQLTAPLTKVCLEDDLEAETELALLRLLVEELRDARATVCFVHVLETYRSGETEPQAEWAARAVTRMRLEMASDALYGAFLKVSPSRPAAAPLLGALAEAMVTLHDASWESRLVDLLRAPIGDPHDGTRRDEELFRQRTAALVLGAMRSERAIRPLVEVVLTPMKAPIHRDAIAALLRIGGTVAPALARSAVTSNDAELVRHHEREALRYLIAHGLRVTPTDQRLALVTHVGTAALALGVLGGSADVAVITDAAEKADPWSRVAATLALASLPPSGARRDAVQALTSGVAPALRMVPGSPWGAAMREALGTPVLLETRGQARALLLDAAVRTFDADLVPFLVDDAIALPGAGDEIVSARRAALAATLLLARRDQLAHVDRLADLTFTDPLGGKARLGAKLDGERAAVRTLVERCDADVGCYLRELEQTRAAPGQAPAGPADAAETPFELRKAVVMLGVLGDARSLPALVRTAATTDDPLLLELSAAAATHLAWTAPPLPGEALDALRRAARSRQRPALELLLARFETRASK